MQEIKLILKDDYVMYYDREFLSLHFRYFRGAWMMNSDIAEFNLDSVSSYNMSLLDSIIAGQDIETLNRNVMFDLLAAASLLQADDGTFDKLHKMAKETLDRHNIPYFPDIDIDSCVGKLRNPLILSKEEQEFYRRMKILHPEPKLNDSYDIKVFGGISVALLFLSYCLIKSVR